MASGPKIVHKQFNSPIGLYSQNNIKETLNKRLQNLGNGTVGIDFSDPTSDKPTNLANSAVLRMLEEEERSRRGHPSQKKVVWPPVPETNGYHNQPHQQAPIYNNVPAQPEPQSRPEPQQHNQYQPPQNQPQYQLPQNQPQYQLPQNQPQYQPPQNQPQYQQRQPQFQQRQPQYQAPQSQPAYSEGLRQEACGLSKLIPVGPGASVAPFHPGPPSPGPGQTFRPGPTSPGPAQPYRPAPSRWAPVPAPVSPQAYVAQPAYPQQPPPAFSPQPYSEPQYCAPPAYSEPAYQPPQRQYEPPPSTITLRQSTPVHQSPPPVYASQPAAASFQGGENMRGDQKWPPQPVREAVAAENEARRQLAQGPACRPRKVKKDYSSFFAQHALNHSNVGYRAPPGTQHYEDHSGRSSY